MSKMITEKELREQIGYIAYGSCDQCILDKAYDILREILDTAQNEKHAFNIYKNKWISFVYTDDGVYNGFGDSEGFSIPASLLEQYLPFTIDSELFRYGKKK